MYNIVENYMTNVDEVMALVKKYDHLFKARDGGNTFSTQYGTASLKQLHQYNMPAELTEAIFKTIPMQWNDRLNYCINKYEPGDYIPRHKDSNGGYWMFRLIFLSSDKPHFRFWDDADKSHLVEEIPGGMFAMGLGTPHEVTKIGDDEDPKYSLCIMQGIDMNVRKVA
jgi:hypothetical protein